MVYDARKKKHLGLTTSLMVDHHFASISNYWGVSPIVRLVVMLSLMRHGQE